MCGLTYSYAKHTQSLMDSARLRVHPSSKIKRDFMAQDTYITRSGIAADAHVSCATLPASFRPLCPALRQTNRCISSTPSNVVKRLCATFSHVSFVVRSVRYSETLRMRRIFTSSTRQDMEETLKGTARGCHQMRDSTMEEPKTERWRPTALTNSFVCAC